MKDNVLIVVFIFNIKIMDVCNIIYNLYVVVW